MLYEFWIDWRFNVLNQNKAFVFCTEIPHKQANKRPAYRFYSWIKLKCLIYVADVGVHQMFPATLLKHQNYHSVDSTVLTTYLVWNQQGKSNSQQLKGHLRINRKI